MAKSDLQPVNASARICLVGERQVALIRQLATGRKLRNLHPERLNDLRRKQEGVCFRLSCRNRRGATLRFIPVCTNCFVFMQTGCLYKQFGRPAVSLLVKFCDIPDHAIGFRQHPIFENRNHEDGVSRTATSF